MPVSIGPEVYSVKTENKSNGPDRHNVNFLQKLDDGERLGAIMGTNTCLPKWFKAGVEAKMLCVVSVKVNEENMKPRKLNSEGNDINLTPCVSLWTRDSEIKRRTGIRN